MLSPLVHCTCWSIHMYNTYICLQYTCIYIYMIYGDSRNQLLLKLRVKWNTPAQGCKFRTTNLGHIWLFFLENIWLRVTKHQCSTQVLSPGKYGSLKSDDIYVLCICNVYIYIFISCIYIYISSFDTPVFQCWWLCRHHFTEFPCCLEELKNHVVFRMAFWDSSFGVPTSDPKSAAHHMIFCGIFNSNKKSKPAAVFFKVFLRKSFIPCWCFFRRLKPCCSCRASSNLMRFLLVPHQQKSRPKKRNGPKPRPVLSQAVPPKNPGCQGEQAGRFVMSKFGMS